METHTAYINEIYEDVVALKEKEVHFNFELEKIAHYQVKYKILKWKNHKKCLKLLLECDPVHWFAFLTTLL